MFLRGLFGPTIANAEINPATGHPVEAGELIGQHHGVPQRCEKDRGAQTHVLRPCADRGERRQCVDSRPGREAVADPDGIIS
jgi:hypothetical protein